MRRSIILSVIAALLTTLVPASAGAAAESATRPARGEVQRLSGATRIETAVEVSRSTFEPDVPVVFVTTAERFPDALTGGPLAASIGAPILLTLPDVLPAATSSELRRLRPDRIVVLGGRDAVSDAVVGSLAEIVPADRVERLFGPTRFETAAEIALEGFTEPVDVAFVTTGIDFPDALAGAPVGAVLGGPVLLTRTNELPDATRDALEELRPRRIVILGGVDAVTDGVRNELEFYTDGEVERWAGDDRFATSAFVSRQAFTPERTTAVYIATGATFPDALTGAAAAGALRGPVLLTGRFAVPEDVAAEIARLAPGGLDVFVLGGDAVISPQVLDALQRYANPTLSSLSGTVRDGATKSPVAGARVEWTSDERSDAATTGTTGRFAFERLRWGKFGLRVSRTGYATARQTLDVAPGAAQVHDVTLSRVASIAGRLEVTGEGTAIVGARVTAQRIRDGARTGPVFEAVTDTDGAFLLSVGGGLPAGRYWVESDPDGYAFTKEEVDVTEAAWTDGVVLTTIKDG